LGLRCPLIIKERLVFKFVFLIRFKEKICFALMELSGAVSLGTWKWNQSLILMPSG